MKQYLFIFGYETPLQKENNQKYGWDDEDSQSIFIIAESKERATEWGINIAERYYKNLFRNEDVSWLETNFGYEIIGDYYKIYTENQLRDIPIVLYGQYSSL